MFEQKYGSTSVILLEQGLLYLRPDLACLEIDLGSEEFEEQGQFPKNTESRISRLIREWF